MGSSDEGSQYGNDWLGVGGNLLPLVMTAIAVPALTMSPYSSATSQTACRRDKEDNEKYPVNRPDNIVKCRHLRLEPEGERGDDDACDPWSNKGADASSIKEVTAPPPVVTLRLWCTHPVILLRDQFLRRSLTSRRRSRWSPLSSRRSPRSSR